MGPDLIWLHLVVELPLLYQSLPLNFDFESSDGIGY